MSASIGGVRVMVSAMLPVVPSTPETCARIVRHRLRGILEAAGERVGPRPDEQVHAYVLGNTTIVSAQMFAALRAES